MKTTTARASLSLGMVLMLALGGCRGHGNNQPTAPPVSDPAEPFARSEVDEALVADILEHHRFHHQGGLLALLAMSLDALGLPDDQELRVERLQADLLERLQPSVDAERNLVSLLANGVGAAKLDTDAIRAAMAQVATTTAAASRASIEDLNRLHDLLTPAQRDALMDRLEAHWALWKQANTGDEVHVTALGQALGLNAEQLDRVRAGLAGAPSNPPSDGRVDAQLRELAAAFRADRFDAGSLAAASTIDGDMATAGADRLTRFCVAVNPVLDEEQRHVLVNILSSHLDHAQPQEVQP